MHFSIRLAPPLRAATDADEELAKFGTDVLVATIYDMSGVSIADSRLRISGSNAPIGQTM